MIDNFQAGFCPAFSTANGSLHRAPQFSHRQLFDGSILSNSGSAAPHFRAGGRFKIFYLLSGSISDVLGNRARDDLLCFFKLVGGDEDPCGLRAKIGRWPARPSLYPGRPEKFENLQDLFARDAVAE